jgi:peptide/nickel transport system permease protein
VTVTDVLTSAPIDAMVAVPGSPGPQRRRRPSKLGRWLAVAWLGSIVASAILADLLPLTDYDTIVPELSARAGVLSSLQEPFGTDALGRSVLSRIVFGARQTITVGLVGTAGSMLIGTVIGMAAGYFRGRLEAVLNVLLDAMLAIPPLVLLLTVAAVGRRDVVTVVVGIVIVGTPTFARLARANTLRVRNRTFVTAARAMGARPSRIIGREVMPSVVLGLTSFAFLFLGLVVVVEGTLSFLGLGIPPPSPSWGGMINDGRQYLDGAPHLVFVPCAFLVLTVLSVRTIGDRVQDRIDARGSAR